MKKLLSLLLAFALLLTVAGTALAEDVNGTVVFGLISSWDNLVPFTNSSYYSSFVISLLYDRLVYVSPDGTVSPRAATAWELSEDGKTVTFTLNPDAKFHDGTPVTAEDWVYSIRLLSKSGVGTLFTDQSLLAALEGTDEAGIEVSENSVAAAAPDANTLTLTFKQNVNLDSFLKSQSYYLVVLPAHLLENENVDEIATWDFWNAPVGSGPAVFSALSADGTELTVTRFSDYYQGSANWDTLIVRQTASSALSSALLTGEVDAVYTPVGNDEAIAMQTLPGAENLTFTLTDDLVYVYTIAINNTIVADERIRQAVSYAIDRDIIAAFLTDDYVSPIGEPMQLYLTADNASYPADIPVNKYDPEKAKELLEAAKADGYDGKFVLAAPVAGQRADMALVVGQLLQNVGFEVELVTIDAATMMADLRAAQDGIYDGGIIVYGIAADPLVRNDIYTTASVTVLALKDQTYEDYQAKIAAATGDDRAALIDEYLHYISDQEAAIWLAAKRQCYVFNNRLGDITDSLLGIANRNIDVWNWVLSR